MADRAWLPAARPYCALIFQRYYHADGHSVCPRDCDLRIGLSSGRFIFYRRPENLFIDQQTTTIAYCKCQTGRSKNYRGKLVEKVTQGLRLDATG